VTLRATVAAVAVVCSLAAGCGDDASSGSAGTTSSYTTSPSTTTTTTTTPPPPSTIPATGGSVLTDDDSVLSAPIRPEPVTVAPGDPCAALGRDGTCGRAGAIAWVTTGDSPVTIYRVERGTATPALEVEAAARADYGAVHVEAADLDGRPGDEVVVGLRNVGTGALLEIEIVGAEATVLAHVTLDRGRARLDPGLLRTWSARYLPDDPNCCPSSYEEAVVGLGGERWRSVPERQVPAAEVPKGDFP
jgi:hypothetical protein